MATPVSNSVPHADSFGVNRLLQGSSWNLSGDNVLTYSLHVIPGINIWSSKEIIAVRKAFDAWEAVANIDFVRIGGAPDGSPENSNADLAITFTANLLDVLIEPGTLGLAIFPDPIFVDNKILPFVSSALGYNATRATDPNLEGDIFIDDFSPFWFDFLNEGGEGFHTIVHEIGHSLGLSHPGSGPNFSGFSWDQLHSVMSYNGISTVFNIPEVADAGHAATPMPYDILAIQYIYGPNMSYHTGNDVYELKDDGALRTIWDAGGTDTFDATDINNGVGIILNLREGGYSYIGDYSVTAVAFNTGIENGWGSQDGDIIYGNNLNNNLYGHWGEDKIFGYGGNDQLIFSLDASATGAFHGGSPKDAGTGEEVDITDGWLSLDKYNGGAGKDKLLGSDDFNDVIYLDVGSPTPQLVSIEVIKTLGGNDLIDLTSDRFAFGNIKVISGNGNDTIWANEGNDKLNGQAGDDTISGWFGNDILIGGDGNDILSGDAGNDTLKGGGGGDLLFGGKGKDILIGGTEQDTFIFDTVLKSKQADTIINFEPGNDLIFLDDDIFTSLATLPDNLLSPDEFRANKNGIAKDDDDRIIYSRATGELFYDADGDGSGAAVKFAILSGAPVIDADDFIVIA